MSGRARACSGGGDVAHPALPQRVAIPTVHPAVIAKMTSTIDDISNGRFGVNIVSGWNKFEYLQMGAVARRRIFQLPLRLCGGIPGGVAQAVAHGPDIP